MAPHRGLVISALAILLTPSQFGDCNKHAIKVKGIAKLCKLSTEFRRVVPFVKHTASEWQTKIKDAKTLLSDIQVMRRQGTEQSAKIPAAFVLFMADTIEAAQNAQEELITIAAEAAATSGLAAGAIDQTISIFRQTTLGSETDYCIEQDGNANKLTDFQSLNFCTSSDNSIAPLVTTAAAAVPNEKISDTEFTDANIGDAKGASNKCAITQHGASGGYHAATHGTADIKWAAGMLKFGNAALGRNAFADISQNKNGPTSESSCGSNRRTEAACERRTISINQYSKNPRDIKSDVPDDQDANQAARDQQRSGRYRNEQRPSKRHPKHCC
uniref:Variant surface glycoprotein 1125.5343 n=1 Tax=Trypanosoma brucei TaxID=5691 RepID=A0A1J0RC48_9TRYP|nr:variant surface glycoprotein 1125.5343 [Trypanosoma brucei]